MSHGRRFLILRNYWERYDVVVWKISIPTKLETYAQVVCCTAQIQGSRNQGTNSKYIAYYTEPVNVKYTG